MEQVHAAAESGQENWDSSGVDRWVEELVARMLDAAGRDHMNLLVTWDAEQGRMRLNVKARRVAKDVCINNLRNEIIYADDSVDVGLAKDSIIVARNAVKVAFGDRNIIIAGWFAKYSFDGLNATEHGRKPVRPDYGSLIVSGCVAEVSHAHGSIISARRIAEVAGIDTAFVNTPNLPDELRDNCVKLHIDGFDPIQPLSKAPLEETFEVLKLIPTYYSTKGAVILRQETGPTFILRDEDTILNAAHERVPFLSDWKISHVWKDVLLIRHKDHKHRYLGVEF